MAILIFGFLIGIHEFGHFIVAKLCKINVLEFAIGMGPAIFKKQGKSTLYSLRLFPLGGYCSLEGEDGDSETNRARPTNPGANGPELRPEPDGSFSAHPAWQRVLVLLAGAFMNFITGMIILVILFSGTDAYVSTEISGFADDFEFVGENMLMPGDRITKINGYHIYLNADISTFLGHDADAPYDIEVERDGKKLLIEDLPLTLKPHTYTGIDENGEEYQYTEQRYGFIFKTEPANFLDNMRIALLNSLDFARLVKVSFFDLFRGDASVSELSGPVGMASMITTTARQSMPNMWLLVALIAINLAVMNLLPIPALDGGRILFLIIGEIVLLIRKKPLDPKYESILNGIFLAALILLMVYVSFNDIMRLVKR